MTLQRLNMDNSWFLQLNALRLLIDPWLEGTEIDYFGWFNTQWHKTPPMTYNQVPAFDAILITQIYPDHFHQKTLIQLNPKLIIAPAALKKQLHKILPQAQIISLNKQSPTAEIKGVKISLLPNAGFMGPSFKAYMLNDGTESVLVAPHGFNGNVTEKHAVKLVISPFNRYRLPFFLGGTLAPGISGLKKLTEQFNPQHIVCTHDEEKYATGLVSKLAKITRISNSELMKDELFRGIILSMDDYKPVVI